MRDGAAGNLAHLRQASVAGDRGRVVGVDQLDRSIVQEHHAGAEPIAAYRDRYGITSSAPLGTDPVSTDIQAVDAARAASALRATGEMQISPTIRLDRRELGPGISL
ncbi:hypothetical protein GCM10027059_11270 [Myceligenerans halotolerans]